MGGMTTKRERDDAKFGKVFTPAVLTALKQLGATLQPDSEERYGTARYTLVTRAGALNVTAYDTWIACRFDDVEAAKKVARTGILNPFSGKYNFMYSADNDPLACVADWVRHMRELQ